MGLKVDMTQNHPSHNFIAYQPSVNYLEMKPICFKLLAAMSMWPVCSLCCSPQVKSSATRELPHAVVCSVCKHQLIVLSFFTAHNYSWWWTVFQSFSSIPLFPVKDRNFQLTKSQWHVFKYQTDTHTCTFDTCTYSQHRDFSLYHQSGRVHLLSYLVLTLMCMFTSSDLLSKW